MERTETRSLAIAAFAIASSILASKAVPGVNALGVADAVASHFRFGMFTADGRASSDSELKLVLSR